MKENPMSPLKTCTPFSLSAFALFAALGAVPALAVPALPTVPSASLAHAKTISVHENVLMAGNNGKLNPFFSSSVRIKRPDQVKVIVGRLDKPGSKPHLYVQNGKTEWEYNALTNQYNIVKPLPGGNSGSQLRGLSQINLILSAGHLPPPPKGVQRTITTDTLDGQPMVLTTDTPTPRPGTDGSSYSYPLKVWVNAKTGLPFRWMAFQDKDGKITPFQEINFSDWKLNTPIPAAQLAWALPAGAKPYAEPTLLAVGTPAPDFQVTESDGKVVHLSDFKGKTVILDFWATWCGPCQASMPHLESVYKQVQGQNVAVLGVCVWDQKTAYDQWVKANIGTKYTFPVAYDPAGRGPKSIAGSLYKVVGIPTQYVIDKNGKVAAASIGYNGDTDHRLEANLSKMGVDVPAPQTTASAK
jgi:peroxiredoxin/outer membrane lipoprotein-sorting protein